MESLVSTEWLAEELGAPDLRVIDASIFLPGAGRDARAEYEAEHIPGAVFLDLDAVVDSANPAPHLLPPEHKFASRMQTLGLSKGTKEQRRARNKFVTPCSHRGSPSLKKKKKNHQTK